jgi:hypothetical protein
MGMEHQIGYSVFRPVYIGRVAENKVLGSKVILVTPVEAVPLLDGEVKSNVTKVEYKGVDAHDVEFTTNIDIDNAIEATWIPFETNRATAPDVRRGERVLVWQSGDADKYYWTVTGLDDDLRRLETVVLTFNANPKEDNSANALENCYTFEVSTHSGQITLRTTTLNGEYTTYVVQLNTKEGAFSLLDGRGNFAHLDSADLLWHLALMTGTFFKLDHNDVLVNAPDKFQLDAKNSATINTKTMVVNSDTTTINADTTTISDNCNIGGDCSVGGNMSVGGSFSGGGVKMAGGTITCDMVKSSGPVIAPNID